MAPVWRPMFALGGDVLGLRAGLGLALDACITGFIERSRAFASHYFCGRPATAGNNEANTLSCRLERRAGLAAAPALAAADPPFRCLGRSAQSVASHFGPTCIFLVAPMQARGIACHATAGAARGSSCSRLESRNHATDRALRPRHRLRPAATRRAPPEARRHRARRLHAY